MVLERGSNHIDENCVITNIYWSFLPMFGRSINDLHNADSYSHAEGQSSMNIEWISDFYQVNQSWLLKISWGNVDTKMDNYETLSLYCEICTRACWGSMGSQARPRQVWVHIRHANVISSLFFMALPNDIKDLFFKITYRYFFIFLSRCYFTICSRVTTNGPWLRYFWQCLQTAVCT